MLLPETIQITYVNVSDLKPAEYNPRKASDEEYKQLKTSLERFGFVDPIVVNSAPERNNIIIGGHFRLRVAKDMGYTEAPVTYVNIPDIKKEQELNVRLNRNTGQFDYDLLANFDEDMLKDIGFDSKELDKIFQLEPEEKADSVPETRQTDIKQGDIYVLGNHRLMCGDSTNKSDVEKLMDGQKADMVFTDPPYGMFLDTDYTDMKGIGRGNTYNKVIGDNEDFKPELILNIFENFKCKEIFLWGADYYAEYLPNKNDGSWMVWDKMRGGEGVNDKYDKMFGSNFELCWSKAKHKRAIARVLWKGIFGLAKEDTKKRVHPTQKPIELCEWFIDKFSKREQTIIDLFGGSGSALIACEKLNRKCYMMELDPVYCQVIIDRWEEFTGQKAKELNV